MVKTGEKGGGQQPGTNQALDAPVQFFGDVVLGKSGQFLVQRPYDDWDVGKQNGRCCEFEMRNKLVFACKCYVVRSVLAV